MDVSVFRFRFRYMIWWCLGFVEFLFFFFGFLRIMAKTLTLFVIRIVATFSHHITLFVFDGNGIFYNRIRTNRWHAATVVSRFFIGRIVVAKMRKQEQKVRPWRCCRVKPKLNIVSHFIVLLWRAFMLLMLKKAKCKLIKGNTISNSSGTEHANGVVTQSWNIKFVRAESALSEFLQPKH